MWPETVHKDVGVLGTQEVAPWAHGHCGDQILRFRCKAMKTNKRMSEATPVPVCVSDKAKDNRTSLGKGPGIPTQVR